MASCACATVVSNEELASQLTSQKIIEQSALNSIALASASLSTAQIEIKKIKDELKQRYDAAVAAENLAKVQLESASNNLAELKKFI